MLHLPRCLHSLQRPGTDRNRHRELARLRRHDGTGTVPELAHSQTGPPLSLSWHESNATPSCHTTSRPPTFTAAGSVEQAANQSAQSSSETMHQPSAQTTGRGVCSAAFLHAWEIDGPGHAPDTGRSSARREHHLSSGLASGAALANPVRHPRNRLVPQLSTLRRGPAASLIENIWNLLPWTLTVCVGNCPRPLSSRCICSARPSVRD